MTAINPTAVTARRLRAGARVRRRESGDDRGHHVAAAPHDAEPSRVPQCPRLVYLGDGGGVPQVPRTSKVDLDIHGFDAAGSPGNLDAVRHFERRTTSARRSSKRGSGQASTTAQRDEVRPEARRSRGLDPASGRGLERGGRLTALPPAARPKPGSVASVGLSRPAGALDPRLAWAHQAGAPRPGESAPSATGARHPA